MKFKDLDSRMRAYETSLDISVPPGLWMVARLDGKGFTKWTKNMGFKKPFDDKFHEIMIAATKGLMEISGFKILYGYTESDEISLLIHKDDGTFNRKMRKLNSTLASIASVMASQASYPNPCFFDCRICVLPDVETVVDYFRWRMEDSSRNCLNGYCYWLLRQSGMSQRAASRELEGKGVAFKNELLFSKFGLNFTKDIVDWHKRGAGLYWVDIPKEAVNPITSEKVQVIRKNLCVDDDLPFGDEDYRKFLLQHIESA